MKKKGFTLVELLAVIAILGILALLITPAVLTIRKNVLLNTLESKINIIDTAACDFGQDNITDIPKTVSSTFRRSQNGATSRITSDCRKVYVQNLIAGGYLKPDKKNEKVITNPVTGESMNELEICIRFDNNDAENRQLMAYIVDEKKMLGEE